MTIELASNLATGVHEILIINITTPNASLSTGNYLTVRTAQSHAYVEASKINLPTIQAGAHPAGISMDITPNVYSYPYAAYQFNFTTTAYSPSDASISIIFPTAYTFDSYAECTNITGLTGNTFLLFIF